MLFHTLEFALLFLAVLPIAIWGGSRARRSALLIASYIFYMWFSIPLVSLLIISSLLDFSVGRALHQTTDQTKRRKLLFLSLAVNLGMLFSFKYTNWFFGSLNSLSMIFTQEAPFPYFDIILPLGISFYTFQTLSYTIDIYRGQLKPTNSLLTFALYVAFFPQLVAGPVVRASLLVPQLDAGPRYKPFQIRQGIGNFTWGLVKKMVFADNLAIIVQQTYALNTGEHGVLTIVLATYAFAIQIYCDFSGYTDMARGIAQILGYNIGVNFNFPFFGHGIRDFWSRWHISLTTWLRDYLYIPLGGNRCSVIRQNINVFTTLLLGGLWHGDSWTYVVWGAAHGIWILAEQTWERHKRGRGETRAEKATASPIRAVIDPIITFHILLITWILFRSESFSHILDLLTGLTRWGDSAKNADFTVFAYMLPLLAIDLIIYKTKIREWLPQRGILFWTTVWAGVALTLIFGRFEGTDFVYFQF